jgi:hypothetical protein
VQGHRQNHDLPYFEIFGMFINPESPPIVVILILTLAAGMDFAQALP